MSVELFDNLALGLPRRRAGRTSCSASSASLLGTLVGVLPGIGPLATIAMLLPMTFSCRRSRR